MDIPDDEFVLEFEGENIPYRSVRTAVLNTLRKLLNSEAMIKAIVKLSHLNQKRGLDA